MFRRVFRITLKLGLIAAVGVGIAMVIKKLTTPPEAPASLEPWPPLSTETTASPADQPNTESAEQAAVESSNGEAASAVAEAEAAPSNN
ncbi:MAG: hypothetical protein WHS89_07705 [Acidimicrobiales bacterium]